MSDVHDMSYYGKCMIGGIFACGLTHALVCPLDIVKCRKQVSTRCLLLRSLRTVIFALLKFLLAVILPRKNYVGKPQDVQEHPRRLQSH